MTGKSQKKNQYPVTKFFPPAQRLAGISPDGQDGAEGDPEHEAPSGRQSPANEDPPVLNKEFFDALVTKMRRGVQEDTEKALQNIRAEIGALTERTEDLESKVEGISNEQAETHEEVLRCGDAVRDLQNKLEDLENRERRQNIRLKNIPEDITHEELQPYLRRLFLQLVPDLSDHDLHTDRAHRALGPKSADPNRHRDVVLRMHAYSAKERIMMAARDLRSVSMDGVQIQLFNDLSQLTINKRNAMRPLTTYLRDQGVKYRWGFPFKLVVLRNGRHYTVSTPEDSKDFLKALGIPLPPPKNKRPPTEAAPETAPQETPRASERLASQRPRKNEKQPKKQTVISTSVSACGQHRRTAETCTKHFGDIKLRLKKRWQRLVAMRVAQEEVLQHLYICNLMNRTCTPSWITNWFLGLEGTEISGRFFHRRHKLELQLLKMRS
ncbi:hypothetical protein FKM82_019315 [Ascaphus truei]